MKNDGKVPVGAIQHRSAGIMCREDIVADWPGDLEVSMIKPSCHPEAGLLFVYYRQVNAAGLFCQACNKTTIAFYVASREKEGLPPLTPAADEPEEDEGCR